MINLKTLLLTWKHRFELGNTKINLKMHINCETPLLIRKYQNKVGNINPETIPRKCHQVKSGISKLKVAFPS